MVSPSAFFCLSAAQQTTKSLTEGSIHSFRNF